MTKLRLLTGLLAILGVFGAPAASQAGGIGGVHIVKYFVSGSTNLPFRIHTSPAPTDCPGGFFYVEWTEPNYQTFVSGLITAYAQNKSVSITYAIGTGGYCRVMEYQVE
ncbi:MAG: hypothetical protein JF617_07670 [Burkholderiales bacterium]|nr:hypothetical protein [Burkholderiales bacterium]